MNNENYDFWFWLSVMANWCQLESYQMNQRQISNDVILQHLQQQDDVLDEQTDVYLKRIIAQNEEIINLLKGGKQNAR